MQGIQATLPQKECIDDHQPGQEEQHSVHFFQTTEIQVPKEIPSKFPDVEKQFHDNPHQHSVLPKFDTKCTEGRKSESQEKVQFAVLLKSITPQVDNERATQLRKLFFQLRKNEITRENFLRLVKDIVGNQMLAEAVEKDKIQEEEQKLFSGPQEGCQMSNSSPMVEQGKEGMLILQEMPLQRKLAKIASKCGIKSISKDVEHCLSLSVEEKMRGLIINLIRISKQRVDFEKRRHKTLVTSDVQHQIKVMNQIIKEDWEKRQAEESERGSQVSGDLEKDANGSERSKANEVMKRMVEEVMRTAAVNVAARAAAGGDDWTSKWKLMAKKAPMKHELGAMFNAQPSEQMTTCLQTLPRKIGAGQETQKGTENTFQRDQSVMTQKFVNPISAKDILAVLELEPQMSKSTFGYCCSMNISKGERDL